MASTVKDKKMRDYNLQPRRIGEIDIENRSDLGDFEPSLTKQAEAEACDINNIMARYEKTGMLPTMIQGDPSYGDFSDMASFQEALGIVAHANSQFAALDAKVRARFNNNPAEMLKFVDEAHDDIDKARELVDLGLALPETESPVEILKSIRENTKASKKAQD